MTTAIKYVHAGDLTTNQAHDLVWNVGLIGERYQEIAIGQCEPIDNGVIRCPNCGSTAIREVYEP